ncbi:MAG: outer membrane beta-barrel protein [Gammaproteobacteria bacterium]|nr:outer membrane beta-barrel protein [Gammaproteobacteria bacterium]
MNARRKPLYQAILLGVTLSCGSAALAIEPAKFKMGAIDLIPTLKLDASQDDNIFRASTDEVDSIITVVAPKLQAVLESGVNLFTLDLEAFEGSYIDSSDDDYSDWRIGAGAHLELNSQNIIDLSISEFATHEPRGVGFSEGPGNKLATADQYDESSWDASYQFGNKDSLGRLVFSLGNIDREYTNNLNVTVFRSREIEKSGAAFYLNLSPRTALLAEYRHTEIDYPTDALPPTPGIRDRPDPSLPVSCRSMDTRAS